MYPSIEVHSILRCQMYLPLQVSMVNHFSYKESKS